MHFMNRETFLVTTYSVAFSRDITDLLPFSSLLCARCFPCLMCDVSLYRHPPSQKDCKSSLGGMVERIGLWPYMGTFSGLLFVRDIFTPMADILNVASFPHQPSPSLSLPLPERSGGGHPVCLDDVVASLANVALSQVHAGRHSPLAFVLLALSIPVSPACFTRLSLKLSTSPPFFSPSLFFSLQRWGNVVFKNVIML